MGFLGEKVVNVLELNLDLDQTDVGEHEWPAVSYASTSGAAPGVGKTYAMLNEGWRRHERGTDVVVGYVETHNRPNTAAQIRDLECVPTQEAHGTGTRSSRRWTSTPSSPASRRGLSSTSWRTPTFPGSRNEKRWEDIDELLDAGIDVISTVNIQHLESLNDVVERITGIKQRETVPDAVVRAADQIELVDMAPEALRRRMAHGNIYGADRVDAALGNYFRVGNLAALRELALLWMADRVDEELHDYRVRHGIEGPWETKERVLVALDRRARRRRPDPSGGPHGAAHPRRARRRPRRRRRRARRAVELPADRAPGAARGGRRTLRRGERHRRRQGARAGGAGRERDADRARREHAAVGGPSSSGARSSTLSSAPPAARSTSTSSRRRATRGRERARSSRRPKLRLAPLSRSRRGTALVLTAVGLPLLTLVLTSIRDSLGVQNALLLYLLFVVAIATIGGAIPGTVASIGGLPVAELVLRAAHPHVHDLELA